jgi:hypothetical protein
MELRQQGGLRGLFSLDDPRSMKNVNLNVLEIETDTRRMLGEGCIPPGTQDLWITYRFSVLVNF